MIFLNEEIGKYLIVNYKVMYSTMSRQKNYKLVGWWKLLQFSIKRLLSLSPKMEGAILVRSPTKRLESFFKDKLRKNVSPQPPGTAFQHCQELFFSEAGVVSGDEQEIISKKLKELPFRSFVLSLENKYRLDGHLAPQSDAVRVPLRMAGVLISRVRFVPGMVLKLEDENDRRMLRNKFQIDTEKIYNSTTHVQGQIKWDSESLGVVKNIYQKDYKLFDYE